MKYSIRQKKKKKIIFGVFPLFARYINALPFPCSGVYPLMYIAPLILPSFRDCYIGSSILEILAHRYIMTVFIVVKAESTDLSSAHDCDDICKK